MEKGARGRLKMVQNTSERIEMRPSGLQQQLLSSFAACLPSRDHSSWRYRGLMEQKAQEREGEVKLTSVEVVTVGLELIFWEISREV